jgi:sugar (pentulose or hexulose) kinase
MEFIGLDIGSSSIKGAVLDLDNLTVGKTAHVNCPHPIAGLPPRHFELDPVAVVDGIQVVLAQLLDEVKDCAGIVSCSQMAGVILADAEGHALTNYLSWRDQRLLETHLSGAGSYYEVLQSRLGKSVMQQLGHECKLGSSPSLLFWLAEQNRLPGKSLPLSLGDFVWMRLCDAEPVTEYTNALGAMNLETRDWHGEAFEKLGIAELNWPRLCDPYQAVGELVVQGKSIPCYPSVGDHQCALAGVLLQLNELSINASTGSQISLLATDYAAGDYQVRPYFDGQYLNTLTHLPAGRSLNVLVDLLNELANSQGITLEDPWPYIARAAAEAETDLTADLSFFAGPMGERGSIDNITVDNLNVGSLFRAAFRNMADNYRACARRLSPNRNWSNLVLSGGLIQHCEVLRELILNEFDCPHRVCTTSEETFTGLLVLALVASGKAENVSAASRVVDRSAIKTL